MIQYTLTVWENGNSFMFRWNQLTCGQELLNDDAFNDSFF